MLYKVQIPLTSIRCGLLYNVLHNARIVLQDQNALTWQDALHFVVGLRLVVKQVHNKSK